MNILNKETGEFGLHVGDVRSWFAQQEIAAAIADEFEGELGPFASYAKTDAPEYDPTTHKAVQIAPVDVDGVLTQQWLLEPIPAPELAQLLDRACDALRQAVTSRRWDIETGGITVGGVRVATGVEDQNRITSVIANAQLAGFAQVRFKAESGFVELTLDNLRDVAAAIALHVQACFTAECEHYEAIGALDSLTAAQSYDTSTGWPAA